MAGPWERYQSEPERGPWDRHRRSSPGPSPEDIAIADPTRGNSFLQNVAIGLGKMVSDTGRGARQLLSPGNEKLQAEIDEAKKRDAPLMGTAGGLVGHIGGNVALALAPGGALLAAGRAAPAAGVAGRYLLSSPATIGGLTTQAGLGSAQSALQPVASDESRLTNMAFGGVGGAAVPALGMAAGAARGGIEPLFQGGRDLIVGRALRRAAGDNADEAARRLETALPLLPGSLPTAAQVAGSPGIAALQRAASAVDPEAYGHRAAQQNLARVEALEGLAGTAGARQTAADAREAAAGPLYQRAYERGVDISRFPEGASPFGKAAGVELATAAKEVGAKEPQSLLGAIKELGGITSTQGTMRDVAGEARVTKNSGIPFGLFNKSGKGLDDLATQLHAKGFRIDVDDVDGGVQSLKNMIREEIDGAGKHYSMFDEDAVMSAIAKKRGLESEAQAAFKQGVPRTRAGDKLVALLERPALKDAVARAEVLARNEGVKLETVRGSMQGLDYVKRALDDAIGAAQGNERRILTGLKNEFVGLLDDLSPSYKKARETYAEMSKPITQMDIAQEIANRAIRPIDRTLQPGAYGRALSDDLVQSVTGMPRATLANTMDPQQLATLNALREDLASSVFAQNAGRGAGSDTAQKLAMGNLMQSAGLPMGVLNFPGIGRMGNWAYSVADEAMKRDLAAGLLNPATAAALMRGAVPSPIVDNSLLALRGISAPLLIGGTSSLQSR